MAFNAEAEVKSMEKRVSALERQLENFEKSIRALPDLAMLAKLVARMDAAEKAIALKKDAKTAEQEVIKATAKQVAEIQTLAKIQAQDLVKQGQLEARLKVIEAQVQTAMAMAKR